MKTKYLKDAVSLSLDEKKCIGCNACIEVCPHGVFAMQENKAVIAEKDLCMECGACAKNCPRGAITVKAGVGCAKAFINSKLTGKEPCCGTDGCCG